MYNDTFSTNQVLDPDALVSTSGGEIATLSPISYGRLTNIKRIPCANRVIRKCCEIIREGSIKIDTTLLVQDGLTSKYFDEAGPNMKLNEKKKVVMDNNDSQLLNPIMMRTIRVTMK